MAAPHATPANGGPRRPAVVAAGASRAMLTPWADVLCVGGAFIALFLVWAALDLDLTSPNTLQRFLFVNFMINAPHFMASSKLLYGSREKMRQYPGVTYWTPLLLVLWSVVGLATYHQHRVVLEALFGASVVSLSWHYTGQTWGMMASFAAIHGLAFAPAERRLIRANLYALMSFHIVWAVVLVRKIFEPQAATGALALLSPEQAMGLYRFAAVAAAASSLLGLAGLTLFVRRTRRLPPARSWIPWVGVHLWYVLLYREPAALFWVQNAHALQYLVFPMRAELNRKAHAAEWAATDAGLPAPVPAARSSSTRLGWSMLRWYAIVTAAGLAILGGLPWLARTYGNAVGLAALPVELTLISCVNLHHYFVDGVIWKIRNPKVRRDLFAHLSPA